MLSATQAAITQKAKDVMTKVASFYAKQLGDTHVAFKDGFADLVKLASKEDSTGEEYMAVLQSDHATKFRKAWKAYEVARPLWKDLAGKIEQPDSLAGLSSTEVFALYCGIAKVQLDDMANVQGACVALSAVYDPTFSAMSPANRQEVTKHAFVVIGCERIDLMCT